MNIAIYGGSFDPFHLAHEKIIDICLNKLDIENLFIVPTFLNPFKDSSFLDASTRLDLINELYKDNKNINIIDYEVKQNKKVSSYQTVNYLLENYDISKIYLIIGADNLKDIHLWYNFKNLKELVQFVVINRDGIHLKNDYINPIYIDLQQNISSTALRKNMELKHIPTKIQNKVKKLWKIE